MELNRKAIVNGERKVRFLFNKRVILTHFLVTIPQHICIIRTAVPLQR